LSTQTDKDFLISRRKVLCAAAGLVVPLIALGATEECSALSPGEPELFVFKGRKQDTVVVAALFGSSPAAAGVGRNSGRRVRLHVGERHWLVRVPPSDGATPATLTGESRTFSGMVVGRGLHAARREHAVVLETSVPEARMQRHGANPAVAVWAEVLGTDGSRRRIASPFVAAVLRRHPRMATAFHRGSPADDARLAGEFAQQVESMAGTHIADSSAHGHRLTAALLPDGVSFRADRPVGFNFAAQNGRHPNDEVDSVVAAVLSGVIRPRSMPAPYPLTAEFPYFVPCGRIV
jgi:hypothetical protein